jgi:DNA transposition AAA+ family ATPase
MVNKAREDLSAFMAESKKSQKQISKETGLSSSVISQFLKGVYTGDNEETAQVIIKYLTVGRERLNSIKAVNFYKGLANTKNVLFAANYAHTECKMALVSGDSGAGKTTALKYYAANNTGVIYITANECCDTPMAILSLICAQISKETPGRRNAMMNLLVSKLQGTNKLIIIDEADHLSLKALQAIRNLNDQANVGILLSGNDKIYRQMLTSRRGYEFDQIRTRIPVRKKVYNDYTIEEMAAIFPQLDIECLGYIIRFAGNESLRGARELYDIALKYVVERNMKFTLKLLENTQKQMQEGFI